MAIGRQAAIAAQEACKFALVTGGCKDVGLQTGLSLAKRLPEGSMIYLSTKNKEDLSKLTENIESNHDKSISEKIKFVYLDFHDHGSIFQLYRDIKREAIVLDMVVNNAQKYHCPSLMDNSKFKSQCEETMMVNYHGLKKVCKTFSPMMSQGGRIVNCSSHLGHLSNLDGREPEASRLREKFAAKSLSEEELDRLVKEFESLSRDGEGSWWHHGWPACSYTVSKIAVNAFTRSVRFLSVVVHYTKSFHFTEFSKPVWIPTILRRTS